MAQYCVNKNGQSNGDHEVHNLATCTVLPNSDNRLALGEHVTCRTAVTKAKEIYSQSNGCATCSPSCHTT